jgi:hypothetical protein
MRLAPWPKLFANGQGGGYIPFQDWIITKGLFNFDGQREKATKAI